jgi:hypothetical protein
VVVAIGATVLMTYRARGSSDAVSAAGLRPPHLNTGILGPINPAVSSMSGHQPRPEIICHEISWTEINFA